MNEDQVKEMEMNEDQVKEMKIKKKSKEFLIVLGMVDDDVRVCTRVFLFVSFGLEKKRKAVSTKREWE